MTSGLELNNVSAASPELERLSEINGERLEHLERQKISGATAAGEEQTTPVQRHPGVIENGIWPIGAAKFERGDENLNLSAVSVGSTVAVCGDSGEKVSEFECDPHPTRNDERGSGLEGETHTTRSGEILNPNSKSYLLARTTRLEETCSARVGAYIKEGLMLMVCGLFSETICVRNVLCLFHL